jgi:threonyl-tRNA synthetase
VRDGDESGAGRSGLPEGLAVLRHSTAHVMAQAVQDLFPEANLGIGPPIKDGFYYDFAVPQPFRPGGPEPHREEDGRDRQERAVVRPSRRRPRTRPNEELAGRALQVELIGSEGGADEIMEVGGKPN